MHPVPGLSLEFTEEKWHWVKGWGKGMGYSIALFRDCLYNPWDTAFHGKQSHMVHFNTA